MDLIDQLANARSMGSLYLDELQLNSRDVRQYPDELGIKFGSLNPCSNHLVSPMEISSHRSIRSYLKRMDLAATAWNLSLA